MLTAPRTDNRSKASYGRFPPSSHLAGIVLLLVLVSGLGFNAFRLSLQLDQGEQARRDAEFTRNSGVRARRSAFARLADIEFERGVGLAEAADPVGVLWMARAIVHDPSSLNHRKALWGFLRDTPRLLDCAKVQKVKRLDPIGSPRKSDRFKAYWLKSGIEIWDLETMKRAPVPIPSEIGTVKGSGLPDWERAGGNRWEVHASPDGTRVVTTLLDGTIQVWDAATGNPRSPAIRNVGFDYGTGPAIARFSQDGTSLIVDGYGLCVIPLAGVSAQTCVNLIPIVQNNSGSHRLLDIKGRLLVDRLAVIDGNGFWYYLADDERHVLVKAEHSDARGSHQELSVWDVLTGQGVALRCTPQSMQYAYLTEDGRYCYAVLKDNEILLWDARTGELVSHLPQQEAPGWVQVSRQANSVQIHTQNNQSRVYDLHSGQPLTPVLEPVEYPFFSEDGRLAGGTSENRLALWNVRDGKRAGYLPHHRGTLYLERDHILRAVDGETYRDWDIGVDRTAPSSHPASAGAMIIDEDEPPDLLQREVELWVGQTLDERGIPQMLDADSYQSRLETWKKQAADHARVCHYPTANL